MAEPMTAAQLRAQLAKRMPERDFTQRVIRYARLRGWLVHHCRPTRMASGRWATAIQGDAGFPDLVLAHPNRGVIYAELKTESGRLSAEQNRWQHALTCAYARSFTWRPSDWHTIVEALG